MVRKGDGEVMDEEAGGCCRGGKMTKAEVNDSCVEAMICCRERRTKERC